MDDVQERSDEQEGKFNRFGNAAEDGCNRSRNEQGCDFLAFFRFGTIVHGQAAPGRPKTLALPWRAKPPWGNMSRKE